MTAGPAPIPNAKIALLPAVAVTSAHRKGSNLIVMASSRRHSAANDLPKELIRSVYAHLDVKTRCRCCSGLACLQL